MQKVLSKVLLVTIIMGLFITPVFAQDDIKIILDGKALDATAVIENNSTLVPLRSIFEALGATVDWYQDTQEIKAKRDDTRVDLQIDNKIAKVNGKEIELIAAPKVFSGSTYVPIRFVSESFGADVEWDGKTKTVNIYHKTRKKEVRYSVSLEGNKKGLRDSDRNVIIPAIYQDLRYVFWASGDLVAVKKDGLWGYVNLSNEVVIPFQYNDASAFYDGYSFISQTKTGVKKNWMMINEKGKVINDTVFETRVHLPEMYKLSNSNHIIITKAGSIGDSATTDKFYLFKDNKAYFLLETGGYLSRYGDRGFTHISDDITLLDRGDYTWVIDSEGNEIIRSLYSRSGDYESIHVYNKNGSVDLFTDMNYRDMILYNRITDPDAERIFIHYHEKDGATIYNSKAEIINDVESHTYAYVKKGGFIFIYKASYISGVRPNKILSIIDFDGKKYFDINDVKDADRVLEDIDVPVDLNTFTNKTIVTKIKNSDIYQVRDLDFDVLFEYECKSLTPVYDGFYEGVVKDQWGNEHEVLLDSEGKLVKK